MPKIPGTIILRAVYSLIFLGTESLVNFYVDICNNADGSSAQTCVFDTQPYKSSETRVYICPLKGRYVRIRRLPAIRKYLQLCEVQVQGKTIFHGTWDLSQELFNSECATKTFPDKYLLIIPTIISIYVGEASHYSNSLIPSAKVINL